MTQNLSAKLHFIASQVNDLNPKGKVKANTANEKGYAKIVSINNSCRVWAHHTIQNALIIDLMYTEHAAAKYPDIVDSAITTFKKFAKDNGREALPRPWTHGIDKTSRRQQHYFDISTDSLETIGALVTAVKLAFR